MADEQGNGEREGKFETPENESPAVPHYLDHSWTFWLDDPSEKAEQDAMIEHSWTFRGSSIRPLYAFDTVEDFWRHYSNIYHPSMLIGGTDIYCFKQEIEPNCEDPICANGGRWTIACQRGKSDILWLHTLLAMIGERFDYGDEICGAVVSASSKQEKIAVWTKNSSDEAAQMRIGRKWKEILDYNGEIGFISHDDERRLDRAAKNKCTV